MKFFISDIMEIINARAATLTNYEVFRFLKEQKDSIKPVKGKKEKGSKQQMNKSLLTVTLETLSWLEDSPAGVQEEHHVKEFAQQLSEMCQESKDDCGRSLQLSKQEVIHLINHRPGSAVEIQLLLENSEERFTEEQVEKLIQIVEECLPAPALEEEDEDAEEGKEVEKEDGEEITDS
jgi:hypothetical protein